MKAFVYLVATNQPTNTKQQMMPFFSGSVGVYHLFTSTDKI